MRTAKVQASLRIRAVSPEPSLLAHTSSESRGTFRQKARSLAPLNGWACAVEIGHDGMLEDTNSLDGAQLSSSQSYEIPIINLKILQSNIGTLSSVCQMVQFQDNRHLVARAPRVTSVSFIGNSRLLREYRYACPALMTETKLICDANYVFIRFCPNILTETECLPPPLI